MDRVLIIDDSEFDRKMIMKAIAAKHDQIEFTELSSGHAIADLITQDPPKIAIVDIRMPGMDGFEVLDAIRSIADFSKLPVLMVSGSESPKDREMAHAKGATGYFVKPPSAAAYFSLGREIYERYLCCASEGRDGAPA